MKNCRDNELERMPGPAPEPVRGMEDYVILLKDADDEPAADGGRHAVYHAGVARAAAFRNRLRAFLNGHRLTDQVAAIGEPTVFPVLAIRCTPAVARQIAALPEVDEVVRDFNNISTARA